MTNVTTYSNPKEMLGYLLVQWIADIREISKYVYSQRSYAKTLIFQIDLLDSQLSTFRSDMFYQVSAEKYMDYWQTMKTIEPDLALAEQELSEKDYTAFKRGVKKWLELMASCYPKLGLVPETGVDVGLGDKQENTINEGENVGGESLEYEYGQPIEPTESNISSEAPPESPPTEIEPEPVKQEAPRKRVSYRDG